MDLEEIAETYHEKELPDHAIERACQLFELQWMIGNIPRSADCLDLGFGDGVLFPSLASHCNLTLLEGSQRLCQKAADVQTAKNLSAEIHCVRFEDFTSSKKFDIVICSHVLEHVADPVRLLRRLRELLSPGGILIGIVPNADSLHRRLGVAIGLQSRRDDLSLRDKMVGHVRVYSLRTLLDDLAEAGLRIAKHRGFFLKPLSNSQLLPFGEEVISGLLLLSDDMPTEMCGNIGFIAAVSD